MINRFLQMIAVFALATGMCHAADLIKNDSPQQKALLKQLKGVKDKIVYESYRDNNWELMAINADGSHPKNLTNTPDINESYPQCSPDGKMIAFECCDNTTGAQYRIEVMNADGTGRRKVVDNARQMAWSPDCTRLAFETPIPGKPVTINEGLKIYDMKTGKTTVWTDGKDTIRLIDPSGKETTPKASELKNLLNLTWSADGKWVLGTIVVTFGWGQSIVAIEVDGDRVIDILHMDEGVTGNILGCRPNVSPDGKSITWAVADKNKLMWIDIAPVDFSAAIPKVGEHKHMVKDIVPVELYHPDWSPDNQFVAFSRGVRGNRMRPAYYVPGQKAPGWDICVFDRDTPDVFVQLTHDSLSNKEPDWLKVSE
ncbi:MAG: hypothetical protein ABFD69_15760 [Candidatus Sumerlaeia bacterium]